MMARWVGSIVTAGIGKEYSGRAFACVVAGMLLASPSLPVELSPVAATATELLEDPTNSAAARASRLTDHETVVLDYGASAQDRNQAIPLMGGAMVAMRSFAAIPRESAQFRVAHRCLSQAIYYEAATEPIAGQRAVAQVVLNRVRHSAYPSTVCGVVYEGWNTPVCQFSFVCDGSLGRTPATTLWRRAESVATDALTGHVERTVGSATHYHADYVLPRWAFTLGKLKQIGHHIFYRFPGSAGGVQSFGAAWRGGESIPEVDRRNFDTSTDDIIAEYRPEDYVADLPPDPTDRRAVNDVGGRLDTSTDWRLNVPMPGEARSALDEAMADHETAQGGELE